mmetsp:Transcript_10581/g.44109  ORF Transcript_10581/g.44109 Transcript_10581/m.44109 type:complete len:142 (-) Transcript_10581:390-815(-)
MKGTLTDVFVDAFAGLGGELLFVCIAFCNCWFFFCQGRLYSTGMLNITESKTFNDALELSFKKIDKDKSGKVNSTELTSGLNFIYAQLGKRLPGKLATPPTAAQVEESFRKYDRDSNGELDYAEYKGFMVQWYAPFVVLPT